MKTTGNKKAVEPQWVEGDVQTFLSLSDADMRLIEARLAISKLLKAARKSQKLTQKAVAEKLGTSQSRVAKIEAGDPSVSLDLLFRSAFSLGLSGRELVEAF
ncbi:MAG TPA: helix-turn-helix domain-containing protein [Chthoniobacteraceae bacterium]|nr:helix-turn-helix domain-containing protein [Chthoniobacteraceae bacterium]